MKTLYLLPLSILLLTSCESKTDKLEERYQELSNRYIWCFEQGRMYDSLSKTHTHPDSIKYYQLQSESAYNAGYDIMERTTQISKRIEQLKDLGE
jgi:hypothetical protein